MWNYNTNILSGGCRWVLVASEGHVDVARATVSRNKTLVCTFYSNFFPLTWRHAPGLTGHYCVATVSSNVNGPQPSWTPCRRYRHCHPCQRVRTILRPPWGPCPPAAECGGTVECLRMAGIFGYSIWWDQSGGSNEIKWVLLYCLFLKSCLSSHLGFLSRSLKKFLIKYLLHLLNLARIET